MYFIIAPQGRRTRLLTILHPFTIGYVESIYVIDSKTISIIEQKVIIGEEPGAACHGVAESVD